MLFILVCTGALIWGIESVIEKHYLGRGANAGATTVIVMFGAAISSGAAQLVLSGTPKVSAEFWWPFLLVVLLNIGIQYLTRKAVELEDVSIVHSLQGLTPLFLILTSWVFLKELPTLYGLLGIILIFLGTYVLNINGQKSKSFLISPWLHLFSSKGARLAIIISLISAIALPLNKTATLTSNPMIITSGFYFGVAILLYGILKGTKQWKRLDRSYFWPLFGSGIILGLAAVLMNAGFLFGITPYVGALKRTQIFWVAVLAGRFLKENHSVLRITGAVVIVAGVFFLAF